MFCSDLSVFLQTFIRLLLFPALTPSVADPHHILWQLDPNPGLQYRYSNPTLDRDLCTAGIWISSRIPLTNPELLLSFFDSPAIEIRIWIRPYGSGYRTEPLLYFRNCLFVFHLGS